MGSAGCLAGTSYCRVTPVGDVTPCPYLPTRAGNVREGSFQEIWAAAGHPHGVFRLRPQDLERLTGAPVADVVQAVAP